MCACESNSFYDPVIQKNLNSSPTTQHLKFHKTKHPFRVGNVFANFSPEGIVTRIVKL